jgi:hypothetical protein
MITAACGRRRGDDETTAARPDHGRTTDAAADATADPPIKRSLVPLRVPGLARIKHIAGDEWGTYALDEQGGLFFFGVGSFFYTDDGQERWNVVPATKLAAPKLAKLAPHAPGCAITATDDVLCLGEASSDGYVAEGDALAVGRPLAMPGALAVARLTFDPIACALVPASPTTKDGGQLFCWNTKEPSQRVERVPLPRPAIAVSGGDEIAVLLNDGTVLETPKPITHSRPSRYKTSALPARKYTIPRKPFTTVTKFPGAIDLAKGRGGRFCARTQTGAVFCVRDRNASATTVAGVTATQVAFGVFHACSTTANGDLYCWGYNAEGQLGDGTVNDSEVPVKVKDLHDVVEVAAGLYHTCALVTDGSVYCFGSNAHGQLGRPHQDPSSDAGSDGAP